MNRLALSLALLSLGLICGLRAGAETIYFTESTTATGSIDGISFVDAPIEIIATADTANVGGSPGFEDIPTAAALVQITGLGTSFFTDTTDIFAADGLDRAGIDDNLGADILYTDSPELAGYQITTSTGPLTGSGDGTLGYLIPTDNGDLIITAVDSSVTFTTAVEGTLAVPEPSTYALLAGGLVMLLGWQWRRSRAIAPAASLA